MSYSSKIINGFTKFRLKLSSCPFSDYTKEVQKFYVATAKGNINLRINTRNKEWLQQQGCINDINPFIIGSFLLLGGSANVEGDNILENSKKKIISKTKALDPVQQFNFALLLSESILSLPKEDNTFYTTCKSLLITLCTDILDSDFSFTKTDAQSVINTIHQIEQKGIELGSPSDVFTIAKLHLKYSEIEIKQAYDNIRNQQKANPDIKFIHASDVEKYMTAPKENEQLLSLSIEDLEVFASSSTSDKKLIAAKNKKTPFLSLFKLANNSNSDISIAALETLKELEKEQKSTLIQDRQLDKWEREKIEEKANSHKDAERQELARDINTPNYILLHLACEHGYFVPKYAIETLMKKGVSLEIIALAHSIDNGSDEIKLLAAKNDNISVKSLLKLLRKEINEKIALAAISTLRKLNVPEETIMESAAEARPTEINILAAKNKKTPLLSLLKLANNYNKDKSLAALDTLKVLDKTRKSTPTQDNPLPKWAIKDKEEKANSLKDAERQELARDINTPNYILLHLACEYGYFVPKYAIETLVKKGVSLEIIALAHSINNGSDEIKLLAAKNENIPVKSLLQLIRNEDDKIALAAIDTLRKLNVSEEKIMKNAAKAKSDDIKILAAKCKDTPTLLLFTLIKLRDKDIAIPAIKTIQTLAQSQQSSEPTDVSALSWETEKIEKLIDSLDSSKRYQAVSNYYISNENLYKLLGDYEEYISVEAAKKLIKRGADIEQIAMLSIAYHGNCIEAQKIAIASDKISVAALKDLIKHCKETEVVNLAIEKRNKLQSAEIV